MQHDNIYIDQLGRHVLTRNIWEEATLEGARKIMMHFELN